VTPCAELVGSRFGDLVVGASGFRPIGTLSAAGIVELGPAPDSAIAPGDRLVVVAQDRPTSLRLNHAAVVNSTGSTVDFSRRSEVHHILVIGWSGLGRPLLAGWAMSVASGSTVEVVFDSRLIDEADIDVPNLDGVSIVLTAVADGDRAISERASSAKITTIVLLAYRDHLPSEEVDSRTLLEVMSLRRALERGQLPVPRLVIELLDPGNAALADATGVDEVVVTTDLASRVLAQLVDDPARRNVFLALYATEGPSIHLVPADRLELNGDVTIREVVAAAYAQGMLAIGWRRPDDLGGELVLDPSDDQRLDVTARDQIVVIA